MANVSRPSGLNSVGTLGGVYNAKARVYCIPDTDDSNAYAVGDPVVLAGSADANGVPTITLATAGTGNPVLGAILSPCGAPGYGQPYGVPAEAPYVIPATKDRAYYVLVQDDPGILYEIQEDGIGGAIAVTSVGLNVNLVAGTNNGYVSGWMIDSSTVGSGATIQMKLERLAQRADNAVGLSAKWICSINNHPLAPNTTGL